MPQAVSLAEILMNEFSWDISGIKLLPGTEGAFEISYNNKYTSAYLLRILS